MIYAAYIKCIKDMHSFSFTKQVKTANPIRKFSPGNYSAHPLPTKSHISKFLLFIFFKSIPNLDNSS